MSQSLAEERIPARMPTAVYDRIVEAAQALGATLNQFLVQSALEKANEVLEKERTIKLSAHSAEALFNLMEQPPSPNANLKAAMEHREQALCSK